MARARRSGQPGNGRGRARDQIEVGIKPLLEKTSLDYQNLVALRTADLDEPWIRDIADAYRSRELLEVTEKQFAGFVKTDYQRSLEVASKR